MGSQSFTLHPIFHVSRTGNSFTWLQGYKAIGNEAMWDCGHVATRLGSRLWSCCVCYRCVARPLTRLFGDVSDIYKLLTYIPKMFLNPSLGARLKFMYHNR